MIRHIVMWTLKDEAEGADRRTNMRKVRQLLESCRDCVPGILEFEVGLAGPVPAARACMDYELPAAK